MGVPAQRSRIDEGVLDGDYTTLLGKQESTAQNRSEPSAGPRRPSLPYHISPRLPNRSKPLSTTRASSGTGFHLNSPGPTAKYVKKSRYKVKEDTYEYKGAKKAVRTGVKRKRIASFGNDNFHAMNVYAERVTLRPKNDQFLFSGHRKAMPLPGQDLPDLTFTRMNYLSRAPQIARAKLTQMEPQQEHDSHSTPRAKHNLTVNVSLPESSADQSVPLRPNPYSSRLATHEGRPPRPQESLDDAASNGTYRAIHEHHSIRSKVDLKHDDPECSGASFDTSAPMSWSTSPSRTFRHAAKASRELKHETLSCSSQQHVKMAEPNENQESETAQGRKTTSEEGCEMLTHHLLTRRPTSNIVAASQDVSREYYNLRDLQRLSRQTSGEGSSSALSALQPHDVHDSQNGPPPAHGPPVCAHDVIVQLHDTPDLPIRPSLRVSLEQEYHCPSRVRNDPVQQHFGEECANISQWSAAIDWTPERTRFHMRPRDEDNDQTLQRLRHSAAVHDDLCYTTADARESGWVFQHACEHFVSTVEGLDAFDLQLLETVEATELQRSPCFTDDAKHATTGHAIWTRCVPSAIESEHVMRQDAATSMHSAREQRYLQLQDGTARVRELDLNLHRPSLQLRRIQQNFNPYGHSCILP